MRFRTPRLHSSNRARDDPPGKPRRPACSAALTLLQVSLATPTTGPECAMGQSLVRSRCPSDHARICSSVSGLGMASRSRCANSRICPPVTPCTCRPTLSSTADFWSVASRNSLRTAANASSIACLISGRMRSRRATSRRTASHALAPSASPCPARTSTATCRNALSGRSCPRLHGLLHHVAQRRLSALADDLFAGVGQHQLDLGAHLRVERRRRVVLRLRGGRVLLRRTQRRLDPAADFAQDDPLLADLMVRQEAAGQQGVAAVVDGEFGQGGAAAAGDEEDQSRPVAVRVPGSRRPWAASPGPGAGRPCSASRASPRSRPRCTPASPFLP